MFTMIPNLVLMRIVSGMVILLIILRCLFFLIIILIFMKKSLFFLIALCVLSLASCKSVGVRVQGHSTILRNDTIRTTYEVAKPLNQVINVDY